jgi:hypothetical protein
MIPGRSRLGPYAVLHLIDGFCLCNGATGCVVFDEGAPHGCIPLASHATAPMTANTTEPKIMRRIMA